MTTAAERLATTAVTSGWVVSRLARHLEAALATLDITSAQYRLLVQLAHGMEASTALARKLAVSAPSVTIVVDGLVQRGIVERTSSTEDRRRVLLELTKAGCDLLEAAEAAVATRFAEVAGTLDDPAAVTSALAALAALDQWLEPLDRFSTRHMAISSGLAPADAR